MAKHQQDLKIKAFLENYLIYFRSALQEVWRSVPEEM